MEEPEKSRVILWCLSSKQLAARSSNAGGAFILTSLVFYTHFCCPIDILDTINRIE